MTSTIRQRCSKYVEDGVTPNWENPSIPGVCYSIEVLRQILASLWERYQEPAVRRHFREVCPVIFDDEPEELAYMEIALQPFGTRGGLFHSNDHTIKAGLVETLHQILDRADRFAPDVWFEHRAMKSASESLRMTMVRCYKVQALCGMRQMMRNNEVEEAMLRVAKNNDLMLGVISKEMLSDTGLKTAADIVDLRFDRGARISTLFTTRNQRTRNVYAIVLENMHYTAIFIDLELRTIEFFDSMGRQPTAFARAVGKRMLERLDLSLSDVRTHFNSKPIQMGGTQCGMFALVFIRQRIWNYRSWDKAVAKMQSYDDRVMEYSRPEFLFCEDHVPEEGK